MNSIRRQLTRELVRTHAALLGAGLVAIAILIWQALVGSFDQAVRARALALSALTEVESGRVQFDFSGDFLHGFGAEHPRSYFEIWDAAGVVLARSPSLRDADLPLKAEGTPDRPHYWNLSVPNGRSARALAFSFVPAPADTTPGLPGAPRVWLVVAIDRGGLNETIEGMLAAIVGCGAILFVAVFLAVPRVLRRGLAPLNQLGEQAARIDAASLASRFPTSELPLELRPIGERLNDLLSRLEASFERERRFSADLAHELRTPISELRSLAECALKWPEARDLAADRDLLAIATQMETLVSRMLTLARGEGGQLAASLAPVELLPLVAHVWQPYEGRAAQRKLRTSFMLTPDTVLADPVLLTSVLANLFDNAVAYAPVGGELRVSGRPTAHGYALQVANPASGLVATDLPLLFDRFWRKDPARSGGEHYGLGLSLASAFAAAMGWRLTADLDAKGWLVFTLATTTGSA